jgi:hypothetical protein
VTGKEDILELITSYETIPREFALHKFVATNENFGLELQPGEGESGWIRLERYFKQASEGMMFMAW